MLLSHRANFNGQSEDFTAGVAMSLSCIGRRVNTLPVCCALVSLLVSLPLSASLSAVDQRITESPAANDAFGNSSQLQVVEGDVLTLPNTGRRSLASAHPARLWVDGIVPYRIHAELPEFSVGAILGAIEHWNSQSGVTLIPIEQLLRDDPSLSESSLDSVLFQPGQGCASWIGRRGGVQEIWVAPNCTKGTMMHEIGHVLGLEHEHTQLDRDQYITVNWDNISADKRHNFDLASSLTRELGEYDYNSIMHYGPYNFSAEGRATITPIYSSMDQIGQRVAPSEGDLNAIAALYSTDLSIVAHLYADEQGAEASIHVSNDEGSGAHDIEVNVSVSSSRLLAYSNNGWVCSGDRQGNITCELERLAASSSSTLLLDLDVSATVGSLHVEVRSKTPDGNPDNNTDQADVQTEPVLAASRYNDEVISRGFGGALSLEWAVLGLLLLYRKTGFRIQR